MVKKQKFIYFALYGPPVEVPVPLMQMPWVPARSTSPPPDDPLPDFDRLQIQEVFNFCKLILFVK